jgi:hypothetical protein
MKIEYEYRLSSTGLGVLIFAFTFFISIGGLAWQSMSQYRNESNAVQVVSSLRLLQIKYASQHSGNFSPTFAKLGEFEKVCVTSECSQIIVDEYIFTISAEVADVEPAFYSIHSDPQIHYGLFPTGTRHFYSDSKLGTIKVTEEKRPATATDPSI